MINGRFLNGDTLVSVPAGIFDIEGDAFEIANNFLTAAERNRATVTSTLLNDSEYVNNLASYYIAADGDMQVAIDNFKFNGNTIPVYWPGGVIPTVTTTASKTDIYSFKIFDGSNPVGSGMYGVIGGQNFS